MNNNITTSDKDSILDRLDDMRYEGPFGYAPVREGYLIAIDSIEEWIKENIKPEEQ